VKRALKWAGFTLAILLILALGVVAWAVSTQSGTRSIARIAVDALGGKLALGQVEGTIAGPLTAPTDKIHPMPFPGLNIDNLPFFAVIAAVAEGQTLLHDWVYENRAIYLTELNKLGAQVKLLDPHRVMIEGPTHFSGAEIVCPPALRPAVVILLAMLASKGTSVLRSTYVIHRGYEDLAERLNLLGAQIETFHDL